MRARLASASLRARAISSRRAVFSASASSQAFRLVWARLASSSALFFSVSVVAASLPRFSRFSLSSSSIAICRRRSSSACRWVSCCLVCSAVAFLEWASAAFCSACWLVRRISSRALAASSRCGVSRAVLASSISRSSFRLFNAAAASSCRLPSRSASLVIWAIWRSRRASASAMRSASRSHSPSSMRRFCTMAACSASAFRKGGRLAASSA